MPVRYVLKKAACGTVVWLMFLVHLAFPGCAQAPSASIAQNQVCAPTAEHLTTCREIVHELEREHYARRPLDDQLSALVLDRYLSDLDPARSCFSEKDIKAFEHYRLTLDDALKAGNLEPAFAIYQRYQNRLAEQLTFFKNLLENDFDSLRFDSDERLETDRKQAPWPHNTAALHELWRKRLTAALLNLKLAGKSLEEARRLLLQRYTVQLHHLHQTTADDVFQLFMNALTRSYDPHTEYLAPRLSENFNISMSLSLEGIGAVLQNDNEYTKIISLVPGGPADTSKQLRPGDRIVGVGEGVSGDIVNVIGWRIDDVVQRIRGPKQTQVRLEIIPVNATDEHQTKIVTLMRDTVNLEHQAASKKIITLADGQRQRKIGIITIPAFYLDVRAQQARAAQYRSTAQDVKRLLEQLTAEQVDGIVLDLRDNGGGSLQEAILLLGMLLSEGPVVQVRSANGEVSVLQDSDPSVVYDGPLAIVVNRLSASASEIVAAALQDYRRGIIIGEQTFGKGTVQALKTLKRGQLKITQAKFYRVTGKSTQHAGVEPDIFYPSLHDATRIGESTLPGALACDALDPAPIAPDSRLVALLPHLQQRHQDRMLTDPDYQYIQETRAYLKELQQKTTVSLNEKVRQAEDAALKQQRLAAENKRRAAKHLPLLTALDESDPDNSTTANQQAPEHDAVLQEAGQVLVDLLTLSTMH